MTSICTQVSPECPVSATTYGYYPNLGANAFFTIYFGLIGVAHIILGIYAHSWAFLIVLSIGTFMESAGYIGRILMHYNPWSAPGFRLQIFCLILAPTFIAAGIYLTLKDVILYVGPQYSRVRPKFFTWVFIGCDVASIVIQAAGGGIVNSAGDDIDRMEAGNHVIIAGIVFQVATMCICGILAVDFFIAAWRDGRWRVKPEVARDRQEAQVLMAFGADAMAYITVLIRCIYRVPEMAGGWGSSLMRNGQDFMILDGMMIASAVLAFALVHPGVFLPATRR